MLAVLLSTTFFLIKNNNSKDSDTLHVESLDDFNFELNFSTYGWDRIDTYNGTFTKDLVASGTKTIKFTIPDNIKKGIYDLLMDIDIMSFPNELKVEGRKAFILI